MELVLNGSGSRQQQRKVHGVQYGDVGVLGARNALPVAGARLVGVDEPVMEDVVGVFELRLDGQQRRHCGATTNNRPAGG